jgi:hypothetical protein
MKILQFSCCVLFGILTKALAQNSDSNLLYKIASEAPGQEHTLKELAIALDELLGLERHNDNTINDKTNFRRLNGDSTITSVVTRIVQILSTFKNRIDNKANTEAITSLQNVVQLKADAIALNALTTTVDGKANLTALNALTTIVDGKADSTDLNDKADLTALAFKADASALTALNTTVNLKADASALDALTATVNLIDTSTFAEKADLEILNTTVQMLNNAIHDPEALQALLALEQSLYTFPSPFTGWDAQSCTTDGSLDGNFTEVINDLNQLIGFDSTDSTCNEVKCDLTFNRVQETCTYQMMGQCVSECQYETNTAQCQIPDAQSDEDYSNCLRCSYNNNNGNCEDTPLILNDGLDDHAACFNVDNVCQMMMSGEYESSSNGGVGSGYEPYSTSNCYNKDLADNILDKVKYNPITEACGDPCLDTTSDDAAYAWLSNICQTPMDNCHDFTQLYPQICTE